MKVTFHFRTALVFSVDIGIVSEANLKRENPILASISQGAPLNYHNPRDYILFQLSTFSPRLLLFFPPKNFACINAYRADVVRLRDNCAACFYEKKATVIRTCKCKFANVIFQHVFRFSVKRAHRPCLLMHFLRNAPSEYIKKNTSKSIRVFALAKQSSRKNAFL